MDPFLRRLAEWKAGRKAAQIIIFDGGADVEKTRSFLRGALTGVGLTALVFFLSAPTAMDPALTEEIVRSEALLQESQRRAYQALQVADVCLTTAHNLERTLSAYQSFLGGRTMAPPPFSTKFPSAR